jgi:chromosome segregation ATPase
MGSGDITKEYDKLDRILAELAEHRVILNGLANKVASIETRVGSIETRLSSLEERLEKKLLETKPIWVAELNGRIDELSGRVDGLSARVDELSGRIDAQRDEMEKGFQLLSGRLDALAIHLNENEGRQRVLDRRLSELERAS